MIRPENPKQAIVEKIFETMANFRPEPTEEINFESLYLSDVARMLLDLSRKIDSVNDDNYFDFLGEVENFDLYIRDPVAFQTAIDEKINAERRAREEAKEAKRRAKEEAKEEERRLKAEERLEKRYGKKNEEPVKPDIVSENTAEVNGLLEAMI